MDDRTRLLRKLLARPHGYRLARFLVQGVSLGVIYAVPLLGLARLDLWSGRHMALREPVDAISGTVAIVVGIASLYVVTFLANFLFGRLFCGWGCPVGQLTRFGEAIEAAAARGGGGRVKRAAGGAAYSAALGLGLLSWWVDPEILVHGSAGALAILGAVLATLVGLMWVHARFWRWAFCMRACPIGLYYSLVHVASPLGIHFDRDAATCKDCDLCTKICPVGLEPRSLEDERVGIGGLAFEGLPADNHCLRCADCVQACQLVFARDEEPAPLRFDASAPGGETVKRSASEAWRRSDEVQRPLQPVESREVLGQAPIIRSERR